MIERRTKSRLKTPQAEPDPKLLVRFITASVAIAVLQGCVVTLISYSSILLGEQLGGLTNGTFFAVFLFTSLFLSASVVEIVGSKWSLIAAMAFKTIFVGSFITGSENKAEQWPSSVVGALFGGIGIGVLWTAQGVYFGATAKGLAQQQGFPSDQATTWVCAIFASIQLTVEFVIRISASLLIRSHSVSAMLLAFWILSVCATVGVGTAGIRTTIQRNLYSFSECRHLMLSSTQMLFLAFIPMCYGILFGLLTSYVNARVTSPALGSASLGFISALVPATAAALSYPYAFIAEVIGKKFTLLFGCLNFFALGAITSLNPEHSLRELRWGIIILYILAGSSRAIFEGVGKAAFADMFADKKPTAFACITALFAFSSSLTFFTSVTLPPLVLAVSLAGFSSVASWGIVFACDGTKVDEARILNKPRDRVQSSFFVLSQGQEF